MQMCANTGGAINGKSLHVPFYNNGSRSSINNSIFDIFGLYVGCSYADCEGCLVYAVISIYEDILRKRVFSWRLGIFP